MTVKQNGVVIICSDKDGKTCRREIIEPSPQSGPPTVDELYMIRECLLLPAILDILSNKRKELERSNDMLKTLHLGIHDALVDRVIAAFSAVRKELISRKIKTWDGEYSEFVIPIKYSCRGYEENFAITRDVARAEIGVKLGVYIAEVVNRLK